jgi:RNA recognition motif-containing protein
MQDKLGMYEPIGKPELDALHEHHLSAMHESTPKPVPLSRGKAEARSPDAKGSAVPKSSSHEAPSAGSWPAPRPIRTPDPTPPGAKTIHVSNLPWSATDEELTALFAEHGTVVQATVMIDSRGRSKGYALVDMPKAEAPPAADALNGHLLNGRPIKVRLSRT